jgi:hypothetical protein
MISYVKTCHVIKWLQTVFELVIGFIAHLKLGITNNITLYKSL